MTNEKEYKLEIDPRILKILSENLYTNIYYVIAELVANAYDADANNVYITISKNELVIEDDGMGMNYEQVKSYLKVGNESRTNEENSLTPKGRRKMGRKGVGKLAALSLAESYKLQTCKNGEMNGFIVTKDIDEFGILEPLNNDTNLFEYKKSEENGTIVKVENIDIEIHKQIETVAKNILKIFPIINSQFRIHIFYNDKNIILEDFNKEILGQLSTLITIGADYKYLFDKFNVESDKFKKHLQAVKSKPFSMKDKVGNSNNYEICVCGWIGTYISTKGRTKTFSDFPDNHISIYANGKMGEFNILPNITTNRMAESYIVGHFHIDIFEKTELPDMSLSNRQGYNTNDIRYIKAMDICKNLLIEALNQYNEYVDHKNSLKKDADIKFKLDKEKKLNEEVVKYNELIKNGILKFLSNNQNSKIIDKDIDSLLEKSKNLIGLKNEVKDNKKKILISHTKNDKIIADIVYDLLLANGFNKEEIIYTNADYQESRMRGGPYGDRIWDYLRDFFVESYVKQGIYVIYLTSENMAKSWGAIVEVGAGWVTRSGEKQHTIVNINSYIPRLPLDTGAVRVDLLRDDQDNIKTDSVTADTLCQTIEEIAQFYGKKNQTRNENLTLINKMLLVKS